MKKMGVEIAILLLLSATCLSGCLDEKSKFIGTWQTQDESTSMTFGSDNKVTITGTGPLGFLSLTGVFNFSIANQKITFSSGDTGFTFNYSFPETNQLILSNEQGASLLFSKQ